MNGHRILRLGETLSAAVRALPRLWREAWFAMLLAVAWSMKPMSAGAAGLIWAPFGLVAILALAGALGRSPSPMTRSRRSGWAWARRDFSSGGPS